MSAPRKYPQELRDRAVRMVFEFRQQTGGQPGAIVRVAEQLGVHREALRTWVRQAEVDTGKRPGVPTAEQQRIAELEREVRELRRAMRSSRRRAPFRGRARPSPDEVTRMIDAHRERFGVEPICRVLEVPTSTYYAHKQQQPSARTRRDSQLKAEIERIWKENLQGSGARKIWRQLPREGIGVARCTVERLMGELGLQGVVGGKPKRTRVGDPQAERPADLVNRQFTARAPNRLWVADLTYVRTWSGFCYAAFIIDAYSRLLVGWQLASHLRTDLALDALEMAIWRRQAQLEGLVHHSDRAANTCRSATPNASPRPARPASVGSRGDSYDNPLAESTIGLYKTELIRRRGPWRGLDHLELATLEWVDWYNHRRLHGALDHVPPAEYQAAHATGYPDLTPALEAAAT